MNEVLTAIRPEFLIFLPVLYTVAEIVKATKKVNNWLIPFILWGVSVVLVFCFTLLTHSLLDSILIAAVQGTILAMATVGGNQFYKQAMEKRQIDSGAAVTKNGNKGGKAM